MHLSAGSPDITIKSCFVKPRRAYSHSGIRTERSLELAHLISTGLLFSGRVKLLDPATDVRGRALLYQ